MPRRSLRPLVLAAAAASLAFAAQAQSQPSPADLEALKAQRERAIQENALITEVNSALAANDLAKAEDVLEQIVTLDPHWRMLQGLGDVQLRRNEPDAAHASYGKAIADAKAKAADAAAQKALVKILINDGDALLKLKRSEEAKAAFRDATVADPTDATAWFNLCATNYNTGDVAGASTACDQTVKLDPSKADAWFIKGSLMLADSKLGKDARLVPPPGTIEALDRYLALQPNGPHAKDVHDMLDAVNGKK